MLKEVKFYLRQRADKAASSVRYLVGRYRRYKGAFIKAVSAATEFLSPPNSTNKFEPLTPTLLEPTQFRRYESELLEALKNKQIRNIAISGEYGAGKSSVIHTFIDRHPEFNYSFVSLAAFGTESTIQPELNDSKNTSPSKKESNLEILTRIEETIVQQLLYSVPAERLPKTRLKRITQASSSKIFSTTTIITLLAISACRLYIPTIEKLPNLDPSWLIPALINIPAWIAIIILGAASFYLLFSLLKSLSPFSIDGLTIKGGKLEIVHQGSALHKHIDELIYCFEKSNIDIIIIEDLDRFGIHDAFTRLREINFIIKQSPQIKRPIYFIYAIRDELFQPGEKTKFFDVIIPIIPVVNSENSREKLIELLRTRTLNNTTLDKTLDPSLAETICYYIDDMRTIKNIVNEFDMFSSILVSDSGLKLDPNKLFSIITIRNLLPKAYADLVKRKGPIYEIITAFGEWRSEKIKQANEALDDLRKLREARIQEIAKSTTELRAYVWYAIHEASEIPAPNQLLRDQNQNQKVTLKQFVSDDFFEDIFSNNNLLTSITTDQYERIVQQAPRSVGTKEILESTSYTQRYNTLQNTLSEIDERIKNQREEIARATHLTFRAGALGSYGETIAATLKDQSIVSYLMRSGYFDTDYTDYFGYFYEGSISAEDKNLILDLRNGISPDVATPVRTARKVIEKLDAADLSDGKGIITDILKELCKTQYRHADSINRNKLSTIFKDGLNGHLDRIAEATESLLYTADSPKLIQAINSIEPSLFIELLNKSERFAAASSKQELIFSIISGLHIIEFKSLSSEYQENLYEAIENLEDVSRLMSNLETYEKGWEWLKEGNVLFNNLGSRTSLEDLKTLIKQNHFKPNLHMLLLLRNKTEGTTPDKTTASNSEPLSYYQLRNLNIEGLQELLLSSAHEFAEALLSQLGTLTESSESLSELLAFIAEDPDLAEALFNRTECTFNELKEIPKSLWCNALESNRVLTKAESVWTFFHEILAPALASKGCEDRDMSALASFMNKNSKQLQDEIWRSSNTETIIFQQYLLRNSHIDNDTLQCIFSNTHIENSTLLELTISVERWIILARSSSIKYSVEIHEKLRTIDEELEAIYLAKRWTEASTNTNAPQLTPALILLLSPKDGPTLHDKISMWEGVPADFLEANERAIEELLRICQLANKESLNFSTHYIPTLKRIFHNEALEPAQRLELLIQCLPSSSWSETHPMLMLMPDKEFSKLSPSSRKIKVPNNDQNIRLLTSLKTRGFIQTITSDDTTITATSKPSEMKTG
ncbi:YobI family P-loop NTPase [Pseudomonas sp. TUM22785]|uniref:YobI family P-loop NTPase n=1 Tax=Pseudomonas sp. TUM22785 TaxID=3019098 RepID=UPI0023058809|nr:hypothetical protein [Pseudomonas sp. TUM22785]WCD83292.1 hypothetical protein PI990_15075 [Pseudomonas sp. TUM22785]